MEYIDLVLVGWVGASWRERSNHARDKILRRDSWRALSSAHKDGVVRSIGLGIYTQHVSKKLFSFEWGASALRLRVPGWARTPIQVKETFWKHFECENSFCKKSRNLS